MKQTLWVIAVVVIAIIIWRTVGHDESSVTVSPTPSSSPVAVKDTTDASLNADKAELDASMAGVTADLNSVDKGLSDTPIQQIR